MIFTEKYDLKKICYAYENLDKIIEEKTLYQNGGYYRRILEDFIINDGEMEISYKYAESTNYGRKYGKGVQPLSKQMRNFLLCDSDVIDLDLKNAHPCILQHICDKYNVQTNKLKEYVLNRDEVIKKNFTIEEYAGHDIKKLILTATNQDKPLFTKNEWLKTYILEIKNIKDKIINHKDFKNIVKDANLKKQDKKNIDSSILNRIICKYESEIIDVIVDYLQTNNYEVFALMFDGLLLHSNDSIDSTISDLNEMIKEEYGSYFNLIQKPIVSNVDMGDYVENIDKIHAKIDRKVVRTALFYKLFDPIKIIHPCLYGIKKKKDGLYEFYKKSDFINATEHIKYGVRDEDGDVYKYVSVVYDFIDNEIEPERIKQEIIVEPENDNIEYYNLWRDWDVNTWEDVEEGDDVDAVDYYKKHLMALCNNEEPIFDAMNLWVAHMFKYPKNKSFIPIFVGKQGAGKDMWISWITALMGSEKKFESVSPEKDVWGDFNPMMKNSYLVHLSEFGRKNTQEYVGKIKSIATSGEILINEKNKGQYFIKSFHRFLGASNFNEPIPIEADNRRYMIIMTSSEFIGNIEYFKKGHSYNSNRRALKSIYKYIMSFDPPSNLNYHMVEDSEYMRYIKAVSVPVEEEWLRDFVKLKGVKGDDKCYKYKASDLYKAYKIWSKDSNKSFSYEQRKFYIQLKALTTQTTKHIIGSHKRDGNFYHFNYNQLLDEGVYTFGDEAIIYDEIHGNSNDEDSDFE